MLNAEKKIKQNRQKLMLGESLWKLFRQIDGQDKASLRGGRLIWDLSNEKESAMRTSEGREFQA